MSDWKSVATLLRRHPVWRGASDNCIHDLAASGKREELRPGQCLLVAGAPANAIHLIIEGVVRVFYPANKTRGELTVKLFRAPAALGDSESVLRTHWAETVQALTPTTALVFPADAYFQVLQRDPTACFRQYWDVARRFGVAIHFERSVSSSVAVKERLIAILAAYAEQFGREIPEGTLIDYPLTQYDLAEQSATNRRDVVRTLAVLYEAGAVLRVGRRYVVVDRDKLLALGSVEVPDVSMSMELPKTVANPR